MSPQKLLAGWHGVDNELDPLRSGRANLQEAAGRVRSDQHGEFVELEHSDRIAVGVKHVVVSHSVLAGARYDDRIYLPINVT